MQAGLTRRRLTLREILFQCPVTIGKILKSMASSQ